MVCTFIPDVNNNNNYCMCAMVSVYRLNKGVH